MKLAPYSYSDSCIARPCGDLVIRDVFLGNAEMTMLFEPCSESHRLIIMSGSQATCISVQCEFGLSDCLEASMKDALSLMSLQCRILSSDP